MDKLSRGACADIQEPNGCPADDLHLDDYRDRYGVKIVGYVMMPNHIHIAVWSEKSDTLSQKLRYIHENPVRRGLVEQAEDWEFSSACWYAGRSGHLVADHVEDW